MRVAIPSIANVVDDLNSDVRDKTELIYGLVQQLRLMEGTIGSQSSSLKDLNMEPTVWGSIADLLALLQKSDSEQTDKIQNLELRTTTISNNYKETASKTLVQGVKDSVFELLKGWKKVIEDLTKRTSLLESTSTTTDNANDPFTTLGIAGGSNANPNTHVQTVSPGVSELVNDITTRVSMLEKQQTDSGKHGLNGAVRFCGVTFTNKDDVSAWLDKNLQDPGGIPPYGLFADPQLLLHWVWILLSGTTNSSARDMKDRISIEMSQDKTYAVDSYQHYIPLVFTGKKSSLLNTSGMDKSRLAQISTFTEWDDATGENGLKQQIAEGLSLVKHSISDLIEETFSDSPEVRAFALGMLHTSCSFIEKLGTYMSETYNNFKDVVGNEKSVWGLVTFVIEQIFRKDFGQVRAKTIGAIDANNRTSGIKIIWSSIRCVDVAEQFMSHGIKNAPAVSASYVRFVITHSNMGKVSGLLEENKILKRKIEEMDTTLATVKKIAEGAKRTADQAMSKATASPPAKKKKKETPSEE
jgi:hypothetical protein